MRQIETFNGDLAESLGNKGEVKVILANLTFLSIETITTRTIWTETSGG